MFGGGWGSCVVLLSIQNLINIDQLTRQESLQIYGQGILGLVLLADSCLLYKILTVDLNNNKSYFPENSKVYLLYGSCWIIV